MRIGIFGGSFNPIHKGHIGLAEAAITAGLVDEVWLMVSPHNPLKTNTSLASEEIRYALAFKALKDEDVRIKASDFEFHLERPSYTWKTLSALQNAYPEHTFSLIIGGDNWEIFDHWAHWEDILRHFPIIVYPREGSTIVMRESYPVPAVIHAPLFPFSSTEIRNALAESVDDETLSRMLPAAIIDDCRKCYGK